MARKGKEMGGKAEFLAPSAGRACEARLHTPSHPLGFLPLGTVYTGRRGTQFSTTLLKGSKSGDTVSQQVKGPIGLIQDQCPAFVCGRGTGATYVIFISAMYFFPLTIPSSVGTFLSLKFSVTSYTADTEKGKSATMSVML